MNSSLETSGGPETRTKPIGDDLVMSLPTSGEEDRLHNVLTWVDSHVRFAEAKNGALLGVSAAIVIAVAQRMTQEYPPEGYLRMYLLGVSVGCAASMVIVFLSFLPVTQIPWFGRHGARKSPGNLLFFGDIRRHNIESYLDSLSQSPIGDNKAHSELERAYAEQIIINAKIAWRKFVYFKIAIWAMIFGLLTPLPAVLLLWRASEQDL
jgi:hypothetical protein